MNQPPKIRVARVVPPEWEEIMLLTGQIQFGEVIIKVQDGKVTLTEYRIKRKGDEPNEFKAFPL